MGAEETNIRVVVRVRPNNRRELEQNQRAIVKVIDTETLLFDPDEEEDEFFYQGVKQHHRDLTKRTNKKLSMPFDRIFSEDETNEMIFTECTKPLVASVMNGYNCSVFVYGATGAGKTFTMLGSENCPGLTFLTMRELFAQITALSENRKFDIGISYLEVYNEQVMNLLTKTGPMRLCEDSHGVVVNGLVLRPIHDADELINLLMLGNRNRTQHPTDANAESSRSHAVFQVHIRMTDKKTNQKRTVKLSMIDLAGSERAASTKGIGVRFKEGASINKSLLALGNCINRLADGSKHIPYRDSNLTRLLKDSLGGNCQTVMVANVSPSSLTYEDTYNTLKYASRAKKIRIVLKQNVLRTNMPKDFFVKKVSEQQSEIEKFKELNKQLQQKLQQQNGEMDELKKVAGKPGAIFDESVLESWYEKIDSAYATFIKAQECILTAKSKERVIAFKAKLKELAETQRRLLCLDDFNLQDIKNIETSVDPLSKTQGKLEEELSRWNKRYTDACKSIEKLRNESQESKYAKILERYFQGKDCEVEMYKRIIKSKHLDYLSSIYNDEAAYMRSTLQHALNIIRFSYRSMRSNGLIDSDYQDRINSLVQLTRGQRDYEKELDEKEFLDISFDGIKPIGTRSILKRGKSDEDDDDDHSEQTRNCKLQKLYDISEDHVAADKDTELEHLNETHVVTTTNGHREMGIDVNTTFQVPAERKRKEFYKNILMDQNVNVSNKNALSKALLNSAVGPHKILNKVSLAVSKDNAKKFSPSKVGKSPRPIARTATSRALASAANFINRQRTKSQTIAGDSDHKMVRVNRTASLRMKRPQD